MSRFRILHFPGPEMAKSHKYFLGKQFVKCQVSKLPNYLGQIIQGFEKVWGDTNTNNKTKIIEYKTTKL